MLILLDDSLLDTDWTELENVAAIDNVFALAFNGYHAVLASQRFLEFVATLKSVSQSTYATANFILGRYSEFLNIESLVTVKTVVSHGQPVSADITEDTWLLPLEFFAEPKDKLVLIGEHFRDAKIYWFAGEHYRLWQCIHGLSTATNPRLGGGQSTADNFSECIRSKNFCLCIVDSDKSSPRGQLGQVARAVLRLNRSSGTPHLGRHTQYRAIENDTPFKLLENSLPHDCHRRWQYLLNQGLLKHTQIKAGFRLKTFFGFSATGPDFEYWNTVLQRLRDNDQLYDVDRACLDYRTCLKHPNCECLVTPPLGSQCASRVLTLLESQPPPESLAQVDPAYDTAWLDIGRNVFEWGVAYPRQIS